jgi:hypothetical protein
MSLQPILAETFDELVRAINDRLRKISVAASGLDEVGSPSKPSSPVPRWWVESNFISQKGLQELLREQVVKTVSTSTSRTTRSHAVVLSVSGTLAIASSVAPLLMLDEEFPASKVRALVKRAPVGDKIVVSIMAGDSEWAKVEVPDGETQGEASVSSSLPAGVLITVDVVQVGSSFPGAGLTVEVT